MYCNMSHDGKQYWMLIIWHITDMSKHVSNMTVVLFTDKNSRFVFGKMLIHVHTRQHKNIVSLLCTEGRQYIVLQTPFKSTMYYTCCI